jgi:hypothetical protein
MCIFYEYKPVKLIKIKHTTECRVEFVPCVRGLPRDECQRYSKQTGDQSIGGGLLCLFTQSGCGDLAETTSAPVVPRLLIERSPVNVRPSV